MNIDVAKEYELLLKLFKEYKPDTVSQADSNRGKNCRRAGMLRVCVGKSMPPCTAASVAAAGVQARGRCRCVPKAARPEGDGVYTFRTAVVEFVDELSPPPAHESGARGTASISNAAQCAALVCMVSTIEFAWSCRASSIQLRKDENGVGVEMEGSVGKRKGFCCRGGLFVSRGSCIRPETFGGPVEF